MTYAERSRIMKIILGLVGALCLVGGAFAAVSGVAACFYPGGAGSFAALTDSLARFVISFSLYITPLLFLISGASFAASLFGMRCGRLGRNVSRLCIVACAADLAAFVMWLFLI